MAKKIRSKAKVTARSRRQGEFRDLKSFGRKDDFPKIQNLVVTTEKIKRIVSATDCTLHDLNLARLRDDLEAAFAQYAVERQRAIRAATPSELQNDLKEIEELAGRLSIMLGGFREAQDAMVRAIRPQYDVPTLIGEPIAPPYFTGLALEISQAAAAARRSTSPRPYVRSQRGQTPINNLISRLLEAWERAFDSVPTFGFTPYPSPFIKFVRACYRHAGIPVRQLEALVKKCRRINAARHASAN